MPQKPDRMQNGFTLLELLVVIAIAGILAGLAVPSLRDTIQSANARAAATAFYTALNRARSEAIANNQPVLICARDATTPTTCATGTTASTAWSNGWIVTSPLAFDATGRVGKTERFDLCRGTDTRYGRRITVARSGRVSLEQKPC